MNKPIFTGKWGKCHIQGIAVDKKNGYIYYSFTTKLIKAKMDGEIIGSIDGFTGHLGCIAFNEQDGCVYGSLEYKNDIIGRQIREKLGSDIQVEDAFYVARFDVHRIDKLGMSATDTDIVKCIYLDEVVKDYKDFGKNKQGEVVAHKHGCSGIDGLTFAPISGTQDGKKYLYVAYGIYWDTNRDDNDYQVLLCYDIDGWDKYAETLNQENMHKNGPSSPLHKYFVYTGNTTYGVQNLEYDTYKNAMLMAVYKGGKAEFPNYSLFAVDMSKPSQITELKGKEEKGETLSLLPLGLNQGEIYGWNFPYGSTGLFSFGNGEWLISHNRTEDGEECADIFKYIWNDKTAFELKE